MTHVFWFFCVTRGGLLLFVILYYEICYSLTRGGLLSFIVGGAVISLCISHLCLLATSQMELHIFLGSNYAITPNCNIVQINCKL